MKKKIIGIMIAAVAFVFLLAPSAAVSAESKCVLTTTLGSSKCDADGTENPNGAYKCSCDDGKGEAIKSVLQLVVRIMTVGIAILGAIGLAISGIQYLTAGGNEEKTRKAKRRVFELVIGLVAYALMYSLLSFFLPGFNS